MNKNILAPYSKKHVVNYHINNAPLYYMGWELELVEEVPDNTSNEDLKDLVSSLTDDGILCKYDGSVDMELVSIPQLLPDSVNTLGQVITRVKDTSSNLISWDNEKARCGFHVHINKKPIKNIKAIYNFILNNKAIFKYVSGRGEKDYYCKFEDYYCRDNYNKRSYYRYACLNNLNRYTLEFRLWRGSLNLSRLFMYLEISEFLAKNSTNLKKLDFSDLMILLNNNFLNDIIQKKAFRDDYFALIYKDFKEKKHYLNLKHLKPCLRNLNKFKKVKQEKQASYNNMINLNTTKYVTDFDLQEFSF